MSESNKRNVIGIQAANQDEYIPISKVFNGCTEIDAFNTGNNNSIVVYTVTAGKTLYLTDVIINYSIPSGVTGYIDIRNESDATQLFLLRLAALRDTDGCMSINFSTPKSMAEGWDIRINAGGAGNFINCYIHGWEK